MKFFTVTYTLKRKPHSVLVKADDLKDALRKTLRKHPDAQNLGARETKTTDVCGKIPLMDW